MKRNCLDKAIILLFCVLVSFSCNEPTSHHTGHHEESLNDEVRKMVQPVNETIFASAPVIYADSMSRSIDLELKGRITYDEREKTTISSRVAGRIERLAIKYNFQPIRKGELIMEIYSPDLLAAQRELLFLQKENLKDELIRSAVQKLRFLGMSQKQINQILDSGTATQKVAVYSPVSGFVVETNKTDVPGAESAVAKLMIREGKYLDAGESVFTVYKNSSVVAELSINADQASLINKGQEVLLSSIDDPNYSTKGTVGLVEPILRRGESFSLVRIYLPREKFIIGEMLRAKIPILIKHGRWLPQSAVIDLGNRSIVFVKEQDAFTPTSIETGVNADGFVQVLTEINNWAIAKDAAYLVDSESFINPENRQ